MWPVGLVTKVGLSSPVVNEHGSVVDFYDGWIASRKFPVDMAGFALNVQLLLEVKASARLSLPALDTQCFFLLPQRNPTFTCLTCPVTKRTAY